MNRVACLWPLALSFFLAFQLPAYALHDGPLELDGNAGNNGKDDWQNVANGTSSAYATTNGVIADTFTPASMDNVLAGGQTKDDKDLDKWKYKSAKPSPDKNNITNAFAAAYNHNGDLVIYFGADRFANDGSAQMGFWFFKNNVEANNNSFTANHADGDLLILANFEGDDTVIVEVWEWCAGCGDNGNTNLKLLATGGECGVGEANSNACAIANPGGETAYWDYTPKSGANGDPYPQHSFFEGGVNLSQLPIGAGCFSSFLAETRSSTSTNAVLKDFVTGSFDLCQISATEVCAGGSTRLATASDTAPDGGNWLYVTEASATVNNSGAVDLPAGTEIEAVFTTPTHTSSIVQPASQVLAAPLGAGDPGLSFLATVFSDMNPPTFDIDVTATLPPPDGGTLTPASIVHDDCHAIELDPALYVSKACHGPNNGVSLVNYASVVAVQVSVEVKICNTGDTPLSINGGDDPAVPELVYSNLLLDAGNLCLNDGDCVTPPCVGAGPGPTDTGVCEMDGGIIEGGTVCDTRQATYMPATVTGSPTPANQAGFSDTITVSGTHPALDAPVPGSDSATCMVCAPDP